VSSGDSSPMLKPTKVPEGTFFVVGDNLSESLDSRFPEFVPSRSRCCAGDLSISTGLRSVRASPARSTDRGAHCVAHAPGNC
jgi:hypothetical protein